MTTLPGTSLPLGIEHQRAPLTSAGKAIALTTMVGLIGWSTLVDMALRWMPWLHHSDKTWAQRLTGGDGYYHHGPAALAVSVLFAYLVWRRVGLPTQRTRRATRWGTAILVSALVLHLLARRAGVGFVSGAAVIAMLSGLIVIGGGRPLWRAYRGPLLLLLFMVPLPLFAITQLTFPLKLLAASAGAIAAQAWGIESQVIGSYVHFNTAAGEPAALCIDDTCSGLRSLITLTWLVAVYVVAMRDRKSAALVRIALALPIAVGCNILRVGALVVAGHYLGTDSVAPETAIHQWIGLIAFGSALGIIALLDTVIRQRPAARLPGQLSPDSTNAPRLPLPTWGLLAIAAIACLLIEPIDAHAAGGQAALDPRALPQQIDIAGQAYQGIDLPITDALRANLSDADILHRRYISPDRSRCIDLTIVAHATRRDAIHPPEVCLRAMGATITRNQNAYVLGRTGQTIPVRGMTTRLGGADATHLYSYHTAGGWTTHYVAQQAGLFAKSMLPGQSSASQHGAVVRVAVQGRTPGAEMTQLIAHQAAAQLLPAADAAMPR